MKSFEELLDFRELSATYRAIPMIQEMYFTNAFYTPTATRDVSADEVEFIKLSAVSTPAPGNVRNGVARIITPQGGSKAYHSLFRAFIEMPLGMDALMSLREFESFALMEKGREVLNNALEEAAIRLRLFKEVVLAYVMHTGVVNLDAGFNPLVPTVNATTGAVTNHASTFVDADFGVADAHRGNLGGTIAALWSVAGTKIPDQLEAIQIAAEAAGVPVPTEIFINVLNKKHLRNNTQFNDWAKYNTAIPDQVLRGQMVENLWGFNWHFIGGKWTDSGGTSRDLMPQNQALICPAVGPWLRGYRGKTPVPRSIDVADSGASIANQFDIVPGEFAYGAAKHNPPSISAFFGDSFGLGFADPNAVWMPTVFSQS